MSLKDELKKAFVAQPKKEFKQELKKEFVEQQKKEETNSIVQKTKDKIKDVPYNMLVSRKKYDELDSKYNNLLKEADRLKILDNIKLREDLVSTTSALDLLKMEKEELENKINILNDEIYNKKKLTASLDEDLFFADFGLYKPQYKCVSSEEYSDRLKFIRNKQKDMIKNKTALSFFKDWVLEGSKSKGNAMNNDNMKMVLRAFNNECDVLISKVKFNNIDIIKERIFRTAESINKLNSRNKIEILQTFIDLKYEELQLVHEFQMKKQEEKETLRRQREEEREEKKVQEQIQKAREEANKEFKHYLSAKEKLIMQLENSINKDEIAEKIKEIDNQLSEIEKGIEQLDYRDANKKAGYVYVISNIGAFGENIYKIGMTRRLDPTERVDELGDASVPFEFDIHAMIFSDNAPALESALHNEFSDKKVNMINSRKEFFNVSLDEIERVIKNNHDSLVEINKVPDAEQYRETLILRNNK